MVQTSWFEPISDSIAEKEAVERAQSFYSNWYICYITIYEITDLDMHNMYNSYTYINMLSYLLYSNILGF